MSDDIIPGTDTALFQKPPNDPNADSRMFGMSVRGCMALMVVGTLCLHQAATWISAAMHGVGIPAIDEPFYGVCYGVIGYYLGAAALRK